tara:strand:+ start:709 stop:1626 length:918 start_codon:yes stop_codon:yes gene_type:complete
MISKNRKIRLRYGENPNQSAYLSYKHNKSIFDYQIHGKKISYNNIVDVDSGLRCLNEFIEPTSIIIKHSNPCGVASDKNIVKAFQKSYESDKKSAFGGIIILNRLLNSELAKVIVKNFFELIVAPGFEKKALDILKAKKNLILLETPNFKKNAMDYRSTIFGDLYQSKDLSAINLKFIKLVSNKTAPSKSIEDIIFSLKVVKHLKSNAIVLTKNKQTIGLGHGHTNRVDALKQAIKNKDNYFKNKSFVCASDGFFPFTDSISLLKKRGCNYIAQPSGSINDEKIISFAKKNNISLYFIKNRLFKH